MERGRFQVEVGRTRMGGAPGASQRSGRPERPPAGYAGAATISPSSAPSARSTDALMQVKIGVSDSV